MTEEKNNFNDRRTPPGEAQPKRLYKMQDGALISGVCAGLGVYFNIDPTIIRIMFVVGALFTHGIIGIIYIFMMIIIPYAKTAEDYASAHGDRVNPYGDERRETSSEVNSKAYWKKIISEQTIYWRKFLEKIILPIRNFINRKSAK